MICHRLPSLDWASLGPTCVLSSRVRVRLGPVEIGGETVPVLALPAHSPFCSAVSQAKTGWLAFCVVFIISIILLSVSFDVVEPTEWGLAYDNNIKKIDTDKVYDEGRYLIGLGRSFIIFPRTYQTIRYGSSFDGADGGNDRVHNCVLIAPVADAVRACRRYCVPHARRHDCQPGGFVPVFGTRRALKLLAVSNWAHGHDVALVQISNTTADMVRLYQDFGGGASHCSFVCSTASAPRFADPR